MAADHFCLKWNNFQSSIITAFESLQTTEDLADVTLTCEGLNVKAHKIILSAFSSYFRTVFKENPCPHPIVILKDVLHADLLAVLNFMYHGEVLILKDQLPSFLQTAEVLQVSGLVGCGNFHIKNVTSQKQKLQKFLKAKDPVEGSPKKPKLFKKAKSNASSPSRNSEASALSPKDTAQKARIPFEVVCVDKIKMEVDEEGRNAENAEQQDKKVVALSMLETALEANQPSILERSLMSLTSGKPGAVYVDHSNILQLASELSKNIHIPKKPPELQEQEKPTDTSLDASTESGKNEDVPLCISDSDSFQVPPGDHLCLQEIPHHSSQCGTCPHCGKIYSNQSALKYHVRLVHSDLTNMYCCHLCPEAFDYREGYKRHMVDAHNVRN